MSIPRKVTRYCITVLEDHQFDSWTFQGSHDAKSWVSLHTGNTQFFGQQCFNIENNIYYEYYRVKIYHWVGSTVLPHLECYEKSVDSTTVTTTTSTNTTSRTTTTATQTSTTTITTATLPPCNHPNYLLFLGNLLEYELSWELITNAQYYELQVKYNNEPYVAFDYLTDNNYSGYNLTHQSPITSLQFRVKAHCGGTRASSWTESNVVTFSRININFQASYSNLESENYLIIDSGSRVQFTDLTTTSQGEITSWSWKFHTDKDGVLEFFTTSTDQNPQHYYLTDGLFAVSLTVTDTIGRTETLTKRAFIEVGCSIDTNFCAIDENNNTLFDYIEVPYGSNVQLVDTSGPNLVTRRTWNFSQSETYGGFCETSTLKSPRRWCPTPGNYAINLTVTGEYGQTRSITKDSFIRVLRDASTSSSSSTWTSTTLTTTTTTTVTTTQTTAPPDDWYKISLVGTEALCDSYSEDNEPYKAFDDNYSSKWLPIYSTTTGTTLTTYTTTQTTGSTNTSTTSDYFLNNKNPGPLWEPNSDLEAFRYRFLNLVNSDNVYRLVEYDVLPPYDTTKHPGQFVYELFSGNYFVGLTSSWALVNPEYIPHVLNHTNITDPLILLQDSPPENPYPGLIWAKSDPTTTTLSTTTQTTATTAWTGNEAISGVGSYNQCSSYVTDYDCDLAFDGTTITYWKAANKVTERSPEWLGFYWTTPKIIKWYKVFFGNTGTPSTWSFVASNNGITWITLDYQYQNTDTGWAWFAIDNDTEYLFYRLVIYTTLDNNSPQVKTFEMYQGYGTTTSTTTLTTTSTSTTRTTTTRTTTSSTTATTTTGTTTSTSTTATTTTGTTTTITTSTSTSTTLTTTTTIPPGYHVDVNSGSDSNPGTLYLPLKTIQRATDLAEPGDVITIHPGIYCEQLIGGRSGTAELPITYQGTDRDSVIIKGSVKATGWVQNGNYWVKSGLNPNTQTGNMFVLVDHMIYLTQVNSIGELVQGTYFCDVLGDKSYYIRLQNEEDPNYHDVECYKQNYFINSTVAYYPITTLRSYLIIKNVTLEKFGAAGAIINNWSDGELTSHWEISNVRFQYNNDGGIFAATNDWYIHDCEFYRNKGLGVQLNGARSLLVNCSCTESGWAIRSDYGGELGVLIGAWAHDNLVIGCYFNDNGYTDGLGVGVYFEEWAHHNTVRECYIERNLASAVFFAGSQYNKVYNNIISDMPFRVRWELTAAIIFGYSRENSNSGPTQQYAQSCGNLVTNNTFYNCLIPIYQEEPNLVGRGGVPLTSSEFNIVKNNLFYTYNKFYALPSTIVTTIMYNGWFNGSAEAGGWDELDTHPITGTDPLLESEETRYFLPTLNSPLVNAGVLDATVINDIRNLIRPVGSSLDIGAYERQLIETTTTSTTTATTTTPPPKTYYVDPGGSDGSLGTQISPFKTITKASNVVNPGDTIIINTGIYHEQITGGSSGTEGHPITYQGADRDTVILRGSRTVNDWVHYGTYWSKSGLAPITDGNKFVMVDNTSLLTRMYISNPELLGPGQFCSNSSDNIYYIRLVNDDNPNTQHFVDVYEYDLGFNAGDRWGGTNKSYITLKNLTIEKYYAGITCATSLGPQNSNWELNNVRVQYNIDANIIAVDDWYIHDCLIHQPQYDGVRLYGPNARFINNKVTNVGTFGIVHDRITGLKLTGSRAYNCTVSNNTFSNNGNASDLTSSIYIADYAYSNIIDSNFITSSACMGIGLYGGYSNKITNNIITNILTNYGTGIIIYAEVTQSVGNTIAFNTIYNCAYSIYLYNPIRTIASGELNLIVNNVFATIASVSSTPSSQVATLRNNGWFDGPTSGIYALDTHKILGTSPGFSSSTWFLPAAGSILIDTAEALSSVTTDYREISRPQGASSDIGAYERQAVESTTTTTTTQTTTTYITLSTTSHTTGTTTSTASTTTTYTYTYTTISTASTQSTSTTTTTRTTRTTTRSTRTTTKTTRTTWTTTTRTSSTTKTPVPSTYSTITSMTTTPPYIVRKTYYVDAINGNDGNTGIQKYPFKTIAKAALVALPGDIIIIQEGTYHEQITNYKTGLYGNPIIYKGVNKDRVIIRGSVTVNNWIRGTGNLWYKSGFLPTTDSNMFVMIDNRTLLTRESIFNLNSLAPGSFCYSSGTYYIRLLNDENPNTQHIVDVYEYDSFLQVGDIDHYNNTNSYISLQNLTIEKYGIAAINSVPALHDKNTNWSLENINFQYNYIGVCALDNWVIQNCNFNKNMTSGCQLDGRHVVFQNNTCNFNGWFGQLTYIQAGLIVGPDNWTTQCYITKNTFNNNGIFYGYGAGIFLSGQSYGNTVNSNIIKSNLSSGIALFGSSSNLIYNNLIIEMPIPNATNQMAGIVITHDLANSLYQSINNDITYNTIYNCSTPIAVHEPEQAVVSNNYNRVTNNLFAAYTNIYSAPSKPIASFTNNGWFCNFTSTGLDLLDTNPIRGLDAKLTNTRNGNYLPQKTSPIVDAGILNFVTTDIREIIRPQGNNSDLGAYERLAYET